jgi:hypothetical protein
MFAARSPPSGAFELDDEEETTGLALRIASTRIHDSRWASRSCNVEKSDCTEACSLRRAVIFVSSSTMRLAPRTDSRHRHMVRLRNAGGRYVSVVVKCSWGGVIGMTYCAGFAP